MTKREEIKLLPCPFCSSEPNINNRKHIDFEWHIFCDWGEQHFISIRGETKAKAIKAWNTRAKQKLDEEKVEKLLNSFLITLSLQKSTDDMNTISYICVDKESLSKLRDSIVQAYEKGEIFK